MEGISDNNNNSTSETTINSGIKEERFYNAKRRKLSPLSIDTKPVFSRDAGLNGMPMSYNQLYIMRRDDDELRTPLF
jgi:hypothetical protein